MAQETGQRFEVWYGMRKAESSPARKRYAGTICDEIYPPHLFMPSKYPVFKKLGVMIRLPIVDWQTEDVLIFWMVNNRRYTVWALTVGLFPCLAGGDFLEKLRRLLFDDFGKTNVLKLCS